MVPLSGRYRIRPSGRGPRDRGRALSRHGSPDRSRSEPEDDNQRGCVRSAADGLPLAVVPKSLAIANAIINPVTAHDAASIGFPCHVIKRTANASAIVALSIVNVHNPIRSFRTALVILPRLLNLL